MIEYPCGCANEPYDPSGILHCVRKCPHHAAEYRDPASLGESYYAELGVIRGGRIAESPHVGELVEALGPLPRAAGAGTAWEIGCGISPYVGAIREAGWRYVGLDASPWAVDWMIHHLDATCLEADFETARPWSPVGMILCAHAIEHMRDAPAAISKMARCLLPGGELWIVVPDDSDPVNPDHWWLFSPDTLRSALESAGLVVERIATRRHVARENFLYARARRAG